MNSATKVGEIFAAAGEAFSKLGDMAMQLNSSMDQNTSSQIRQTLKKKAYEEAGIPENAKILSSENNLELNNQQIVISNIDTQSSLVATTLNEDDIVGSNLNESMASKFEINVKQENILLNSDN
ncbi:unnamed protein product [Gordionus sp. m RMFG-2023]|uniref:uncharacterized protein LOC135922817 isoform X2 n=1 Tax=Gordionus sp. m RMFG-2023 TaxID=3053472 RepID=UPI0030E4D5A0